MPLTAAPLLASGIYFALLLLLGYAVLCAVLANSENSENGDGPRFPITSPVARNGDGPRFPVTSPVARNGDGPRFPNSGPTGGQRHWAELYGFSFAAGSGAISLLLFLASLWGIEPSRLVLLAVAAASLTGIVALALKQRLLLPTVPTPRRKIDPRSILGIAAAATVIAAAFNVQARSSWPGLNDIDSFAIWMFKAKWVALSPLRPMPPAFHDPGLSYSHQDYPLALPFLVAGIYAVGGGISEESAKTLLLPQYLALVAIVYSALRRFHRRAIAVTVTAIFAAAPVLTRNAGLVVAETSLLLAYTAALAMLLRWMETGSRRDLILAGFFASVAAFTKNEGLALLPVIGAASLVFALTRRTPPPPGDGNKGDVSLKWQKKTGMPPISVDWCIAAAVSVAIITPWLIFRSFLPRTHEDYGGKLRNLGTVVHNLPRLTQIVPFILGQMRETQNAGLIWYVLLIAAIIGWRGFRHAPTLILWIILLAQLSLYTATFIVTPWSLNTLLAMITPKLLVQTTPVVALLIGLHLRAAGRSENPGCEQPGRCGLEEIHS